MESFNLEPGESQELTISFHPILVQLYEGIVSMQTNDANQTDIEMSVSGNGDINTSVNNRNNDFLSIYPQPATELVFIESQEEIKSIIIYNLNGQEVFSSSSNSRKTQIDISDLQDGIYMIQVEMENVIHNQKLIIQ